MSVTLWKWAEREPFGVGPLPRATPARKHAGGPARGNPAGRGLRQNPESTTRICLEHDSCPLRYCEPSPKEGLTTA